MSCEGCGGQDASPVSGKRGLRVWRCTSCGLCFVHPQPEPAAIEALYAADPAYAITRHARLDETSPEHAREIDAGIVAVRGRRGTLLDVGCSTGTIIYHLRALGWSVTGVDLNGESLAVAKRHGLDVRLGTIDELAEGRKYDVILFGDVIEHVPSPRRTLEKARSLLEPGGLVVIEAPNAGSNLAGITLLLSRATGASWVHSEAPYHLWEFSETSMRALLARAGFAPASVTYHGRMPFLYAVGASGHFDGLKRAMKKAGRYRFVPSMIPQLPKLALVATVVAPCWVAAMLLDRANGCRYKMRVLATMLP